MPARRWAVAVIVAAVVVLTGCTGGSIVERGTVVTVATTEAFTSYNDRTAAGATAGNAAIVAATNSRFFTTGDDGSLEPDPSYGGVEAVSTDPLVVRYSLTASAIWSDGVPVDAADLLLAWAAGSGRFAGTGVDFGAAGGSGLHHVTRLPQLGGDGRSLTLEYDEVIADWRLALEAGLPAHIVAEVALGSFDGEDAGERAAAAKAAVIEAVQTADIPTLSRLAEAWATEFDVGDVAEHGGRAVGSGPYRLTIADPGASVTLVANPHYLGDRRPSIETIILRHFDDPLEAAAALGDGTVDVFSSTDPEVPRAFEELAGVTVATSDSAAFEHLDLQAADSRSGHFDDPLVREAFLAVVPRALISGGATVRDSFVLAPGEAGYDEAVESNDSESHASIDEELAGRLLEQAGVVNPEVCILFDPADARRQATFALIRDAAANVGFVVTDCSSTDWTRSLGASRAYDAALFAWSPSTSSTGPIDDRLRSDSAVSNLNRYASAAVDGLLDDLVTADGAERIELLADIDAELWSDSYGLPLYQHERTTGWNARVDDVTVSPWTGGVLRDVWRWQPVVAGESTSPSR